MKFKLQDDGKNIWMKNKMIEMKIEIDKKTKSISVHGHNNKKGKQVVYLLTERSKKFFEWIFKKWFDWFRKKTDKNSTEKLMKWIL